MIIRLEETNPARIRKGVNATRIARRVLAQGKFHPESGGLAVFLRPAGSGLSPVCLPLPADPARRSSLVSDCAGRPWFFRLLDPGEKISLQQMSRLIRAWLDDIDEAYCLAAIIRDMLEGKKSPQGIFLSAPEDGARIARVRPLSRLDRNASFIGDPEFVDVYIPGTTGMRELTAMIRDHLPECQANGAGRVVPAP